MTQSATLRQAAIELDKLDEAIARMAHLASHHGPLKISIPTFESKGEWIGECSTICGAVQHKIKEELKKLEGEKILILNSLANTIQEG